MRRQLIISTIAAIVSLVWFLGDASGQSYLVRQQKLYILSVGSLTFTAVPSNRVLFEGGPVDPDDPIDPPTDTLTQRVAARAKAINEPAIAASLGINYTQLAKSMRDNATTFAAAMTTIKQLDSLSLTVQSSAKRPAWDLMLKQLYSEIQSEPQTAATLDAIAAGFVASNTAAVEPAIDWLKIVMCIIQGTVGGAANEPTPAPIPMPTRHRVSVLAPVGHVGAIDDPGAFIREWSSK